MKDRIVRFLRDEQGQDKTRAKIWSSTHSCWRSSVWRRQHCSSAQVGN